MSSELEQRQLQKKFDQPGEAQTKHHLLLVVCEFNEAFLRKQRQCDSTKQGKKVND
jgi:hypothetical protein